MFDNFFVYLLSVDRFLLHPFFSNLQHTRALNPFSARCLLYDVGKLQIYNVYLHLILLLHAVFSAVGIKGDICKFWSLLHLAFSWTFPHHLHHHCHSNESSANPWMYQCSFCGMSFAMESDRDWHQLGHSVPKTLMAE